MDYKFYVFNVLQLHAFNKINDSVHEEHLSEAVDKSVKAVDIEKGHTSSLKSRFEQLAMKTPEVSYIDFSCLPMLENKTFRRNPGEKLKLKC